MQFNSYIFILCFLPLVLIGYFGLHLLQLPKLAKLELLGMSLLFYGYFNKSYLIIICVSILLNFAMSKWLLREQTTGALKKASVVFAVFINLGLLFYFKYFDFFIENINGAFSVSFELHNIVLPLGISFFTFQQLSYVIDSYRGETKEYSFLDYAVFVAFFPQLVAGPIVLHKEMIPQFQDEKKRSINYSNIARGLFVFSMGLFKKVIIADTFGKAVTWGFGNIEYMTFVDTFLVMLSYTFQIYFDFSGYCDMAIGIGSLFNIQIPMNFNSPYKAKSIVDFWDRWHMTLTRFLREYLYFPLGGSRKGTCRTYLNIMIVFFASGIWHGANWTFILWGVIHGIGNVLTRMGKGLWGKLHGIVQWTLTFLFINLTWVLFRADSVEQAGKVYRRLFDFETFGINETLAASFQLPEISFLLGKLHLAGITSRVYGFDMWVFLAVGIFIVVAFKNSSEISFKPTIGRAFFSMGLLVWSIVSLSGITTFLYFNF